MTLFLLRVTLDRARVKMARVPEDGHIRGHLSLNGDHNMVAMR